MVLGLCVTLGIIYLIQGEQPLPFLLLVFCVCVPLTLWYLWTHRAPDNTRFTPE